MFALQGISTQKLHSNLAKHWSKLSFGMHLYEKPVEHGSAYAFVNTIQLAVFRVSVIPIPVSIKNMELCYEVS